MLPVDKKTKKRTKLHIKICPICKKKFGTYRNERKLCSRICQSKLNSINKSNHIYRQCLTCGKDFPHTQAEDRRGSRHLFCSMSCRYPNKKLNLPRGQYYSSDKYIILNTTPDGRKQIKLHRYVMEQFIGRKLLSSEIVHHINSNKLDNRIENLIIMTKSEHNILHFSLISPK